MGSEVKGQGPGGGSELLARWVWKGTRRKDPASTRGRGQGPGLCMGRGIFEVVVGSWELDCRPLGSACGTEGGGSFPQMRSTAPGIPDGVLQEQGARAREGLEGGRLRSLGF